MKKIMTLSLLILILSYLAGCNKNTYEIKTKEESNEFSSLSSLSESSNKNEFSISSGSSQSSSETNSNKEQAQVFENPVTEELNEQPNPQLLNEDELKEEEFLEEMFYSLCENDKKGIIEAAKQIFEKYEQNNGTILWDNKFEPSFAPIPKDFEYSNLSNFEITIGTNLNRDNFKIHIDENKYKIVCGVMNVRDNNWCITSVRIFDKLSGMEIKSPLPAYTEDELITFYDYLRNNLNKEFYTYIDVFTPIYVEPMIMYVDGYENKIDEIIRNYDGKAINIKKVSGKYSLKQLEKYLSQINNLEIVKNDYKSKPRKISGISIYKDKIEIIFNNEIPELIEDLKKYPSQIIKISTAGVNPCT